MRKIFKKNAGQTLIELLMAIGVFSLIIAPFLSSLVNTLTSQVRYRYRSQGSHYAREGLEIAYNLAVNSESWEDFAGLADTGDTYYPQFGPESVELIAGLESLDGLFERKITMEKARRDVSGNITQDPTAPIDENTIKATCQVSWLDKTKEQSIELSTYLIEFERF